jgi:hypothetical protein
MANQKSISTDLRGDSPPRFTISLLMQTTAGIAVVLAILKTLGFDSAEFWAENWLTNGALAIFLAIPIAFTGFALGLLAIPVRNVFGARIAFPVYGGHWLLIYHALLVVLLALALNLMHRPLAPSHDFKVFITLLLVGSIYFAGGLVWMTAFLRNVKDGSTWREYYGLRAAFHFLGFLFSSLVILPLFFAEGKELNLNHIPLLLLGKAIDLGGAGLFFIGVLYRDWMISAERDWLHWLGLAHLIVIPVCLVCAASFGGRIMIY